MNKETKVFQTEVQEILKMMIHSLYSSREIFLRELISNSSDALDKLRFEESTNTSLQTGEEEKHIRLVADPEAKTLEIRDNGIGMSRDEVVQNIGTIAYSGSKSFLKKLQEMKDRPELIGQFGVGFYSAFMVADQIELHTQRAGQPQGTLWISRGDGSYTVEDSPRPEGHGTTIRLTLKPAPEGEEHPADYTDTWTLKNLVRKYSDFIEYPIRMKTERQEAERDKDGKTIEGQFKTVTSDDVLNSRKALWSRASKDISDDEYKEFYKHVCSDWSDPADWLHFKAEGTQEFDALLYTPSQQPFDYNQRDMKYGPGLYVKRVFIMNNCEDLVPPYLRFLRGVVDSADLPLNVSREMIQKDQHIQLIRKGIIAKTLRHLATVMEKDRPRYEGMWKNFGATLKEGVASDHSNRDKISPLLLFHSSSSGTEAWVSLKEYVARMKDGQKDIYFMTGESTQTIQDSPHLERLRQKQYEVLYLTDPVDEWMISSLTEFEGKKLVSIAKEGLELDSEEEKKQADEELKSAETKLKPVTESIRKALESKVKEVKLSRRLVDSAACLVAGVSDPSAHMEKLMEAMGQSMPKSKRIMEINPSHPIYEKMLTFAEDKRASWAELLYNQALINEGSQVDNPRQFTRQIANLMLEQAP